MPLLPRRAAAALFALALGMLAACGIKGPPRPPDTAPPPLAAEPAAPAAADAGCCRDQPP